MTTLGRLSILMLAGSALLGCGGSNSELSAPTSTQSAGTPPAVLQAKQAGTAVPSAIVLADNDFGLSLLKQLLQSDGGNVAISPLSVSLVLQILYNGAGGQAESAMQQTLNLGSMTPAQVNAANAALQASLISPDPVIQLTIANSLWTHSGESSVSSAFIQADQTYYGATLGELAGAPQNVNDWVSTETDGLISTILPPGDYSNATAVLANAIYFKGEWTTTFDSARTAAGPFTLSDGSQVSVPMMNRSGGTYGFYQGANFQLIRLPYGAGRMSMLIVVPQSGLDIGAFTSSLSMDSLKTWIGQLQDRDGPLSIPKFKTKFSSSLNVALQALGMTAAFSASPCFPQLAGGCLSDVEHATVVEVDEQGTVAAGSTSGTVTAAVPPTLSIDQPFVYAIHDEASGELLFLGVLRNPLGP